MGSHTWCYTKATELTKEKMVSDLIGDIDKEIGLISAFDADGETEKKQQLRHLRNNKRVKDWILSGRISDIRTLSRLYNMFTMGDFFVHNGIRYEKTKHHDIFRVSGYPETVLLSLEETKNFLQSEGLELNERTMEFWQQHPNGCIEFG